MKKTIDAARKELLQKLPKVDELLLLLAQDTTLDHVPMRRIKSSVRDVLAECRDDIIAGNTSDLLGEGNDLFLTLVKDRIREKQQFKFRRVINCTGVVIHTNLGRSILPGSAMEQLGVAGSRYSNLEFDLMTGQRGSRYSLVEELLCELTGAEAALVVNNNAAAVLIVLETMAKGREVVVSRGQLVEIGGSFRIPDVMARSGANLVEVGATNRTHLRDYENALTEQTAALLKVHCSNYRIIGFSKEVSLDELVSLGRARGIPVIEDLGSGCFVDLSQFGLEKEPTVQEVVRSGVDVVSFSGDKLLGGPQAGIIVGKKQYIDKIKKNPLNRALRIDKFTLSGLESILRFYLDEKTAITNIPTLTMIATPVETIDRRCKRLIRRLGKNLASVCRVSVEPIVSRVGGGAMPEQNLESRAVALSPAKLSVNSLETSLRKLDIPVIGRIENDRFLMDMRTVLDDELTLVAESLKEVLLKE